MRNAQKIKDKKNPQEDKSKEIKKEITIKPWNTNEIEFLNRQEDLLVA